MKIGSQDDSSWAELRTMPFAQNHAENMFDQIREFFSKLLETESWPARWHCGTWTEFHGWLYIFSDLAIWLAYFAIPLFLVRLVTRKKDLPLPTIFWLFGAFILLCGMTHLIDALMFWWPAYRLNGLVRFLTAVISLMTVISMYQFFPVAAALKTSLQYDEEIQKRLKTEKSLIEAKERAENSEKVKQQFLSNMSHEIRTPMNAIIGFTGLMERTKLSPDQFEWLQAIKYSSGNLLVIINDILDFAKIESGTLELDEKKINIADLVHSAITMLKNKADDKGIGLIFSIDSAIPEVVLGDSVRLTQVLLNLLSNAVKFTNQGEVKVEVLLLEETDDTVSIEFSVTDTGIGIQEQHLETIFDSFSQISNNNTRLYGGTGLGLAIAKKLTELQGGTLAAFSKYQEGSCFKFKIPFKKVDLKDTEDVVAEHEPMIEFIADKRVLVVEDNPISRKLVSIWLELWKLKVDLADNGKVAIEKLMQNEYDIVLMDIQMPEMDGYETTRHIRTQMQRDIPIIAMTAHALKDEIDKCMRAGMNNYISKPFNPTELLAKLVHHIKYHPRSG